MGSQGQKVAGYLVGQDESGQTLEDAGTGEEDEHLFMYQIGPDGPPTLTSNAMSWTGGAQPWLHPEQAYTLRVDMSEPNGASDLTTVEISSLRTSSPHLCPLRGFQNRFMHIEQHPSDRQRLCHACP